MNYSAARAELKKANAKIAALEIKGMLDARPDLSESTKRWCRTQDAHTVRTFLSANAAPTTTVVGDERAKMHAQMGLDALTPKGPSVDELGRLTIPTVRPSDMSKVKLLNIRVDEDVLCGRPKRFGS